MLKYILGRLLATIPVVVLTSVVVFALMRLLPGDPIQVIVGQAHVDVSQETIDRLRQEHGLDKPVVIQYVLWVKKVVSGDLGRSIQSRQPVWDVLRPRILPTVQIGLTAWLLALLIGIPTGVLTAM